METYGIYLQVKTFQMTKSMLFLCPWKLVVPFLAALSLRRQGRL